MTQVADQRVRVDLGARSYDIIIGQGLLARAGGFIKPLAKRSKIFVVADAHVARLHLPTLARGVAAAGLELASIEIAPGEASKSMGALGDVLDSLIRLGAERDDLILALGGGVVGDLTGLAAGLLKRGARYIQLPTTLLAQVDSSVGGKTAVNSEAGKNMIGLFHQPTLVLADLETLDTLPRRERAAGLAEVVKYALIDDRDFFEFLEKNAAELSGGDKAALAQAVRVCCAAKARIVAKDETEKGDRALLNLGHTFGHALERAENYSGALLHGEAVAVGMMMALRYSSKLGLCPGQDVERAGRLIKALGLATRLAELRAGPYDADDLLASMGQDKKAKDGKITLILARGIGASFVQNDADMGSLREFLSQEARRLPDPTNPI